MWAFIAGVVIAVGAAYFMRPKPESTPRPSLADIEAPTAEEGIEIGVVFGCEEVTGPNVVYFDHLKLKAIKSDGGKK